MTRHAANSAAALTLPSSRLDAARCGIALYGSTRSARPGPLRASTRAPLGVGARAGPAARPRESTGYGRRFVATDETWVGIVPVGYADGFRRDMSGTEILVGGVRAAVVGTVSMDALAVRLPVQVERGAR